MFLVPPARLMDVERWERIKQLFEAALEREESERPPFLTQACLNDLELRLEVESLLSGEKKAGDFLQAPIARLPVTAPISANSPSTFSAGQIISGRFKVLRFIAHGGMGEVYEARDLELGERVALKSIRPDIASDAHTMARFKQEIQLARRVTHPNVCRMFDLELHRSETDPSAGVVTFLTMELLEGETLAARLGRVGRIATTEAFPLVQQMAAALAAAHDVGVVHRDFKPGNVMLVPSKSGDGKERAVVTDFGLAKAVAVADQAVGDGSTSSVTASGHIIGTLAYMAPEQLQGREATPAGDIYALGLVMYEMVAGKRPFEDEAPLGGARQPIARPPGPPRFQVPDLDSRWEQAILHCLEVDPARRFATGRELCAALGAPVDTRPRLAARKRRILMASFGGVFTLLLMTAVFFGSHPDRLRALWGRMFPPPLPANKNLVVIPFRAVGGGREEQVYCDGFTETVTTKLARATTLQVSPALEVVAKHVDSIERARTQLGANLIIDASWQHMGKMARLNLSLIDATNGRQLRTATITESADDLFSLQDQVVSQALHMLQVQLSESEENGFRSHGTTDLTAYDFYVQGMGYMQRYEKPENVETAIGLFKRATETDPRYVQAYAALARAYWYRFNATREPQWVDYARAAVKAAERLNSQSVEAQLALGDLNWRTGAYASAVSAYQRTLAADPNSVDALDGLGLAYDSLGRSAEAEEALNRAIAIRSACWNCYNTLGQFLNRHARYADAIQAWQKMTELTPDNVWGYMNIGAAYFNMGKFEPAADYFRRASQISPEDPDLLSNAGTMSFFAGRFEEDARFCERAVKLRPGKYAYWGNLADAYRMIPAESNKAPETYRRAIALAQKDLTVDPNNADVQSDLALYHARAGDSQQARNYLQRALRSLPNDVDVLRIACLVYLEAGERQEALSWLSQAVRAGYPRGQLLANPELASLRSDVEFERLVKEAKTSD